MTKAITVSRTSDPDDNSRKYEDFYQTLRKRIRKYCESRIGRKNKWVEYLLFAPDLFHVLIRLSIDSRVPFSEKANLLKSIAYFVSPIDLLPELIFGPAGYVDDVVLSAYVLNGIINRTSPEVVRQHWAGNDDVLDVISNVIRVADQMIGSGLLRRLKAMFR